MNTNTKKILRNILCSSALTVGLAASATSTYWGYNSGNWSDASSWSVCVPTSYDDAAIFMSQTNAITVTFSDAINKAMYLDFKAEDGVTDNNGPFVRNVYLKGNGNTVELAQSATAGYRRKIVYDNLTVKPGCEGTGGSFGIYGKVVFKNKSSYLSPSTAEADYGGPSAAGSSLVIDDSYVHFRNWGGSRGRILVKNGGHLSYDYSYVQAPDAWRFHDMDIRVIDGDARHQNCDCFTYGFVPERSGTFTTTAQWRPYMTDDMKVRIGGSAIATNVNLYVTNNAAFYGRGKLQAQNITVSADKTLTCDLSEITVHDNRNYSEKPIINCLGDTTFRWMRTGSIYDYPQLVTYGTVRGIKTFSCSYAGISCGWGANWASLGGGLGLRFVDGVSTPKRCDFTLPIIKPLETLEIGDDNWFRLSAGYYCKYRTRDFKMGARAIFSPIYYYNNICATGDIDVDPTATINVNTDKRTEAGKEPQMVFASLDANISTNVFKLSNEATVDGYYIQRVGGSYFYWDGTWTTPVGWRTWRGQTDGYWSHNNWQSYKPDADNGAYFHHYQHCDCTNDFENLTTPFLRFVNGGAPFVLNGNPVTLTATGVGDYNTSAIASKSRYPQIVALDIKSEQSVLGVSTSIGGTDQAVICLRGKVDVPNGAFAPYGDIIIDGTVNAQELAMQNYLESTLATSGGHTPDKRPTILSVRKTGTVNIANQVATHSTTSSFWIAKGGAVNITGDWKSTGFENEHLIKGTLAIAGALGGTKSQYYGGTGVLKAQTTDATGGATLKVGEGLTLAPTTADFGAMPIEVSYGNLTLAPTVAGTLAQDVNVAALGSVITVTNDVDYALAGDWTGYDFDLVKKGTGKLTLNTALDSAGRGFLAVEQGTLVLTKSVKAGRLTAAAGTTLELVADSNGQYPVLSIGDDVNLTGVTIKLSAPTSKDWQTIMTTSTDAVIKGLPTNGALRFRVVQNADDTMTLQARPAKGLLFVAH